MRNRVVISGMGLITPMGIGIDPSWERLKQGRSGVDRIRRFDTTECRVKIGAEIDDFEPDDFLERKQVRRLDRYSQFALVATDMALDDARLDRESVDGDRVGVIWGSGIGGIETMSEQFHVLFEQGPSRLSPLLITKMIANMAAGQIAIFNGFKGPNTTTVTACASSAHAIGDAFRMLERGDADVMVAGGSESAFVPIAIGGFASMRALSTRNDDPPAASRPFDLERDGFVMGEGAGSLVLERLDHALQREAPIYAELVGYAMTADAYHVTAPPPDGEGGARSMKLALEDAGLPPQAINYINAHGTSTPAGDIGETRAIRSVFGDYADQIGVSSTKSMTGHLLGAAGAVELIITVKSLNENVMPPTINYEYPDPECDLFYVPNEAAEREISHALTNSFGFGGQNASIVVGSYDS